MKKPDYPIYFDIVEFLNKNYLLPNIYIGKYTFNLKLFSNHSHDFRVCYELTEIKGSNETMPMWNHKFIKGKFCDFLTLTENARNEDELRKALVITYNTLVKWKIIKNNFPFSNK